MMMRKALNNSWIVAMIALCFAFGSTSCNEDDGPTTAQITVLDTAGNRVPGVDVRVFCSKPPACIIDDRKVTNSRGVSTHEFDLPAVLQIRAVRIDSTVTIINPGPFQTIVVEYDSVCGNGFVTIEANETARETITLFECIE